MIPKLMALSIEAAPGTAVTNPPPASVRFGSSMPSGARAQADHTVFGLKEDIRIRGQVIGDQAWQADAQIDEVAGFDFQRDAARDDFLRIHQAALSSRWSISAPGVLTTSGGITPTGTINWGSAITVSAASAITGLKLWAVSE